ncbi:LAME_0C08526g1_1 [Lachancea meyersii CBS 8951]|uniref:LAME_0C08526g1_1 n=1 Tax=Lachancea meyersii CBS 8951 TaxID=1266667 RepID=A0A1G4J3K4_9SACH|nr:LAME_0C08526g1_1 [Lachancea meyersii CBS 8951]
MTMGEETVAESVPVPSGAAEDTTITDQQLTEEGGHLSEKPVEPEETETKASADNTAEEKVPNGPTRTSDSLLEAENAGSNDSVLESQAEGQELARKDQDQEKGTEGQMEGQGEGEGEQEDEEEGETRCICGEVDPPDESGLYIQCEQCSVWQHGFCVGITEGEGSAPDKYWCEQCRPELHTLYTTDAGQRRSVYKPVQQSKRQNRRSKKDEEASHSSDKASNGANSTGHGNRAGSLAETQNPDVKTENQRPIPPDELKPRKRQQRRKEAVPERFIHGRRYSEEDRRSLDRRRATSSAREEKQYQLMLEKALKESRRTSQADDELEANVLTEAKEVEQLSTQASVSEATVADEPPKKRTKLNSNTNNSPPNTSMTSSEEDSRRKTKRGGPRKVKSRNLSRASSSNEISSGTSDVSINKPIKPRLPTQKTSLNEMRRRVGAILEFISRTQLELSDDQIEKQKFTEFVENQEFVEKVDVVYTNFDESLKTMDDLTRKLLIWEKKYASDQ